MGPMLFAIALTVLAAPASAQGSATDTTKREGLVAFLGTGAALDARAGIPAENRLWLRVGDEGAVDPFASLGAPATALSVDAKSAHAGENRELVEGARAAKCIVLAGGETADWLRLLVPGGWPSELGFAIREAHTSGVPIVGAGSAAPFLAQWAVVDRSVVQRTPRNPRRNPETAFVEGLGLVPGILVDTGERGDPVRTLRAGFDANVVAVLWLDGGAAWIADPVRKSARVAGSGTAVFFDLAPARVMREAWREGRVSALAAGDEWTRRHGPECADSVPHHARKSSPVHERHATFTRLRTALEQAGAQLRLHEDERTRYREASEARPAATCGVSFDLEWRTGG